MAKRQKVRSQRNKKSILPTLAIILLILLLITAVVLFVLLFKPSQGNVDGPLDAPSNLEVTTVGEGDEKQYFATFSEVEGADKYVLHIDNTFTHASLATVVDITKYITEAKKYSIGVQAVDNVISSYNSEVTYTEYANVKQLATPNVDTNNDTKECFWTNIPNATNYELEISYGDESDTEIVTGTTYNLYNLIQSTIDPTITVFSVVVTAKYEGEYLWLDSEPSKEVSFFIPKSLDTPVIEYNTKEEADGVHHVISWEPVEGVQWYELYVIGDNNKKVYENINPVVTEMDITSEIGLVGDYEFYLKAMTNQEYVTSSTSNVINKTFTYKLATPTGVKATAMQDNLQISWNLGDGIGLQTHFIVQIKNKNGVVVRDVSATGTSCQVPLNCSPSGYYDISVLTHHETNPYYIQSDPSESFVLEIDPNLSFPSTLVYTQLSPDATASLSWSSVENAYSYKVKVYELVNNEENILFEEETTSTIMEFPIKTAGVYYTKVMALSRSSFYLQSTYGDAVECVFKSYLDTVNNIKMSEDGTTLSWDPVENADGYAISINGIPITELNFVGTSVTNMDEIFADVTKYPSSKNVPYSISVRACGAVDGVYADGAWGYLQYYLIRILDAPANLVYSQVAGTNEAIFSWDPVENATNGYMLRINGVVPVALQQYLDVTCDVSKYLIPGYNTLEVCAVSTDNYDSSSFSKLDFREYTYYMQGVIDTLLIETTVSKDKVAYVGKFVPHKFANVYTFKFYKTDGVVAGETVVKAINSSNVTYSFDIDPTWIKAYDDCITKIELTTEYDNTIGSTKYDVDYIIGDTVGGNVTTAVTEETTYTNSGILAAVANEDIYVNEIGVFDREIVWSYPTLYLSNVEQFDVSIVCTKTTEVINQNKTVKVTTYDEIVEKTQFSCDFTGLPVGIYKISIRTISKSENLASSTWAQSEFILSVQQQAPTNAVVGQANGNMFIKWDVIPTHENFTTYYVTLNRDGEDTPVKIWNSYASSGLTEVRDDVTYQIVKIDFDAALMETLKSGLYYATIMANQYGEIENITPTEYYYKASSVTTTDNFEYDATISRPSLFISENASGEPILNVLYMGDSVTFSIYYKEFGEAEDTYISIPIDVDNLQYTRSYIDGVAYMSYMLNTYIDEDIVANKYDLSAKAHKTIDGEAVVSGYADSVSFEHKKQFERPDLYESKQMYNLVDGVDTGAVEFKFTKVQATQTGAEPVNAGGYRIELQYNREVVQTYEILPSATGFEVVVNKIKIMDAVDVSTFYTSESVYEDNITASWAFADVDNKKMWFELVEFDTYYVFKLFNTAIDSGTVFEINNNYSATIVTMANTEYYYTESETNLTSFNYLARYGAPVTSFDTVGSTVKYKETNGLSASENLIVQQQPNNPTETTILTFTVYAENLLDNTVYSVTGIGTMLTNARLFEITAGNYPGLMPKAGLYKITVKYDGNLTKLESRASEPLYVYHGLNQDTPQIVQITKQQRIYNDGGSQTTYDNPVIHFKYDGFKYDSANLTFDDKYSFTFSILAVDVDDRVTPVDGETDYTEIVLAKDCVYDASTGLFSYEINLTNSGLNSFLWTPTDKTAPVTFHYRFGVEANAYETDITEIIANMPKPDGSSDAYIPTSSLFDSANQTYKFYQQSEMASTIIRRDAKLDTPTNIRLEIVDNTAKIVWDNVFDQNGTSAVSYGLMFYTYDKNNTYTWYHSGAENEFNSGEVITFDTTDNRFETSSGNAVDETINKDADNYVEIVGVNYYDVTSLYDPSAPLIFGVWIYAYPEDTTVTSSGYSDVGFGVTSYSTQFNLPTQILIDIIDGENYNGYTSYRADWFNETLIDQVVPNAVTDYSSYNSVFKQIYELELGGYTYSNYDDAYYYSENGSDKYGIRISAQYWGGELAELEKVGSRLYSWKLTAKDYSYQVYTNTGVKSDPQVLFTKNTTSGTVYRPVTVNSNSVNVSDVIREPPSYIVPFELAEYPTYYQIRLLTTDRQEIPLSNYINGVRPGNATSVITVDVLNNIATYTQDDGTVEQYAVTRYTDSNGKTYIYCEIKPLLTGLLASGYMVNVYAITDEYRRILAYGEPVTEDSSNVKTFRYEKAFEGISNPEVTYNEEGLIQNISWDVTYDADGNYVHDTALFEMVVYSKADKEVNDIKYIRFDGDVSTITWVKNETSVTGAQLVQKIRVENDRVIVDVAKMFTDYITVGEEYIAQITVKPLSGTISAFLPSEAVEVGFAHRIKLKLEDEGTNYVRFLVDTYLDTSNLDYNRTAVFTDEDNAQIYLDSVGGQYNIKSVEVLNWISNSGSFALYKKVGDSWGEPVTVFTSENITRLNNFLDYGVNDLAIQALGINEYYVQSDFKEFSVTIYEQYQKPSIGEVVWSYASDGVTVDELNIYLGEDVDASKEYGVVIYCYRVVDGVDYLVWQTSDHEANSLTDDPNRLVWKYVESRKVLVDAGNKEVNFMDYFKKYCYYDFDDINEYNDIHMIGPFEYKFSAMIMAYKERPSDNYRLNSKESDKKPATPFAYTYKLNTPELAMTDETTVEAVEKGLDYVDVIRDTDDNVENAYVRWLIEDPKFKTQIKYTITVWDGKSKRSEDFRKSVIDKNVVRYSVVVNIDYPDDTLIPEYSIVSVWRQDFVQQSPAQIDEISKYFVIDTVGSYKYIRFELLNYIMDTENRQNSYGAGVYRFNVQATEALNRNFWNNFVVNTQVTASDVAYKEHIAGASDNEALDYFYEYIHEIPYPVQLTNVGVDTNGTLSMTLEDVYATANKILIYVNGSTDNIEPYVIETPKKDSMNYLTGISRALIPGSDNTVQVQIDEVEYYMKGAIVDANLAFDTWTTTLGTLNSFRWDFEFGIHTISWNMQFNPFYASDPQLDSGNGEVDADKVHYKIELLYSNNSITQSVENNQLLFDQLKSTAGIDYLCINDINGDIIKFRSSGEDDAYSFNLLNAVLTTADSAKWLEGKYLRGGWYVLKVSLTTEDASGNRVANYNDAVAWTTPVIKRIASPWELSATGELVGDNVIKSTQTNVSAEAKEIWAGQQQTFGLSFSVTTVDGYAPTEYVVYYWRDGEDARNEVTISGDKVTTVGNNVYLELGQEFVTVALAGVYNFAWKANQFKDENGEVVAESSELSYLLTEKEQQRLGYEGNYGGYGLGHYVRVNIPTLDSALSNTDVTSCTISWRANGTAGENLLGFKYNIRNYISTEGDYYQGMPAPTDGYYSATINELNATSYSYDRIVNNSLNMLQNNVGLNYIAIQAIPVIDNPYYIESKWSALHEYEWNISLSAPELEIKIENTIPENEIDIENDDGGVNYRDYATIGGIRETEESSKTYTDYWAIKVTVDENGYVLENNELYAYFELAVYDPVTNSNTNPQYAIAHYILKGRVVNGGDVTLYQKSNIGVNAENSQFITLTGSDARVVGKCVEEDGNIYFMVTGFKSYELLPIVTYDNVTIIQDGNYVAYSGTKNFADIPQLYKIIANSYDPTTFVRGSQTTLDYQHQLRYIAPTVTEVQWTGNSIAQQTINDNNTNGEVTYIKNDTLEDYQLTVTVKNVSKWANHIMLYVYVDQTDGHLGYVGEDTLSNYYSRLESNLYPVTKLEERDLEEELRGVSFRKVIYNNINEFIDIPDGKDYGTLTLQITKTGLTENIWLYINHNTPNVLRFAAQAVSENGLASAAHVWDGDQYEEKDKNGQTIVLTQELHYVQSNIGTPFRNEIYRQFEKAEVNVQLDPGQGELDASPLMGATKIVEGHYNNLNHNGVALDPYLYVQPFTANVEYEYEETKTFGRYEITASINGKQIQKQVESVIDGGIITNSGLIDAYEIFEKRVSSNPARYGFVNGVYEEYTMLENPAIYKLIYELLGGDSATSGGTVTIELRVIREDEPKNYWVNQDVEGQNSVLLDFYLRPKAVEITLNQANFDTTNPLVVNWNNGDLSTDYNELLYPNNLNLSWTASSGYIQSYFIDILTDSNSTYSGGGKNQGTSVWTSRSVDLARPAAGWGGGEYESNNPSTRFNNWGEKKTGNGANPASDTVPVWNIHVEPNPIPAALIGKSYPSGAGEGSSLANLTQYYLQLKLNSYKTTLQSSLSVLDGNGYKGTLITSTNGTTGPTLNMVDSSSSGDYEYFNFVKGFKVVMEGYFDGYNVETYDQTWTDTTFSLNSLRNKINEWLADFEELNNGAYGCEYSVQYKLLYGKEGDSTNTIPYLEGEYSPLFTYEYYRTVEVTNFNARQSGDSIVVSSTNRSGSGASHVDEIYVSIQQRTSAGGSLNDYSVAYLDLHGGSSSETLDFNPGRADALSSTTISDADVYINNNVTNYTSYIQGGNNKFSIEAYAGGFSDANKYNIPYYESERDEVEFEISDTYAPEASAEWSDPRTLDMIESYSAPTVSGSGNGVNGSGVWSCCNKAINSAGCTPVKVYSICGCSADSTDKCQKAHTCWNKMLTGNCTCPTQHVGDVIEIAYEHKGTYGGALSTITHQAQVVGVTVSPGVKLSVSKAFKVGYAATVGGVHVQYSGSAIKSPEYVKLTKEVQFTDETIKYDTTKNGVTYYVNTELDNAYTTRVSVVNVYCKPGFGSVIESVGDTDDKITVAANIPTKTTSAKGVTQVVGYMGANVKGSVNGTSGVKAELTYGSSIVRPTAYEFAANISVTGSFSFTFNYNYEKHSTKTETKTDGEGNTTSVTVDVWNSASASATQKREEKEMIASTSVTLSDGGGSGGTTSGDYPCGTPDPVKLSGKDRSYSFTGVASVTEPSLKLNYTAASPTKNESKYNRESVAEETKYSAICGGNAKYSNIPDFLKDLAQGEITDCTTNGHYIFNDPYDGAESGVCLVCGKVFETLDNILASTGATVEDGGGYVLIEKGDYCLNADLDVGNYCYYVPSLWKGEHFYYSAFQEACTECGGTGLIKGEDGDDVLDGDGGWDEVWPGNWYTYRSYYTGCAMCGGSGDKVVMKVVTGNKHEITSLPDDFNLGTGFNYKMDTTSLVQGNTITGCTGSVHFYGEPTKTFKGYVYSKSHGKVESKYEADSGNYLLVPIVTYTYTCACGQTKQIDHIGNEDNDNRVTNLSTTCTEGHAKLEVHMNFAYTFNRFTEVTCLTCGTCIGYKEEYDTSMDDLIEVLNGINTADSAIEPIEDFTYIHDGTISEYTNTLSSSNWAIERTSLTSSNVYWTFTYVGDDAEANKCYSTHLLDSDLNSY
ncbi:MAG: hypothetical protein IJW25_01285 [Clostridia bacterium]|nr:hypothetical protein [Clostridia bacterium]